MPAVVDQVDERSRWESLRRRDGRQRCTPGGEGDQERTGQNPHDQPETMPPPANSTSRLSLLNVPGTSRSNCGVAAVDEQVAACHEGRGIAREVDGGAGYLLGQTEATKKGLRPHHLARLVHVLPAPEHASGLDGARRDRVGPDALPRVVHGEHLGELDEGAFARAVRGAPGGGDTAE